MSDYTIEKVSQQEPRKWHNDKFNSDTWYIKVKLQGVERAVEIGKRSPDALKAGDTVHGTIQSKPDFEADGFKADAVPFGGGAGKPAYQPKDEEAIARAVALKAAVDFYGPNPSVNESVILAAAEKFLAWLKERPEALKDEEPRYTDNDYQHMDSDFPTGF